jgi:hypothetical protein
VTTKTSVGGRPPLPEDERLSELFKLRVTSAQKERITEVAPEGEVSEYWRNWLDFIAKIDIENLDAEEVADLIISFRDEIKISERVQVEITND